MTIKDKVRNRHEIDTNMNKNMKNSTTVVKRGVFTEGKNKTCKHVIFEFRILTLIGAKKLEL